MANRSPTEFHFRWADITNVANLPNVPGSPTQSPKLAVGDLCYDSLADLYYYCTDPTLGVATWSTFGSSGDRYAPRFIVGNATAGDTASVCNFLDPGDGTGIAAAVAAANALGIGGTPVDIHIRPGAYFLSPALCATGYVMQTEMTIRGAGQGRTLIGAGSGIASMNAPVFDARLTGSFELTDMTIAVGGSSTVAPTFAVMHGPNAKIRRINLSLSQDFAPVDYGAAFGMINQGYPDGVEYDDIEVRGVTSDSDFAGIRLDSGGQRGAPNNPARIHNVSMNGLPALPNYAGVLLVDVGECFVEDVNVNNLPYAVRILYQAPFISYTRGPVIDGVFHRIDGSAYQSFAVSLRLSANVGMQLNLASFTNVEQDTGGGIAPGSAFLFDVLVPTNDVLYEPTFNHSGSVPSAGPAFASKIYVYADGSIVRPRFVDVHIDNELQLQATVGGSIDSPLLLGNGCVDLFVNGATVLNAQVVSNRIRGVYTDTGTGTTNSVNIIGP